MWSSSSSIRGIALIALCAVLGSAHAQDDGGPLLKGDSVTEANLVRALEPPLEGVDRRGIKLSRDGVSQPGAQPSAALLITFVTNSWQLTAQARRLLDIVGQALKNDRLAPYNFTVEGHADPRGTADANQVLSEQRAASVREYLVSEHGIAADRLQPEGRGDREPLNRAVPAAPENRRVRIVTQL